MNLYSLIKKPVITEKTATLADESKYTFEVDERANKVSIKKAFQVIYGVLPEKVSIINTAPKSNSRLKVKKRAYKKAIVTLKKGETIDISKVK